MKNYINYNQKNRYFNPGLLLIFYHNIPVAVKNGGNISLRVFTVKICRIIVFYAGNARLVVNELQSVALLYDSAVFIVGKGNAALASPSSLPVISKCDAIELRHLTAVCPRNRLSAIGRRIPDFIVSAGFVADGNKTVSLVRILNRSKRAFFHVFFQREICFPSGQNIPAIVIRIQIRLASLFINARFRCLNSKKA